MEIKKARVYISGPISGKDMRVVKWNFEAAEQALEVFGYEPVSPLKNGLDPSASWEDHMKADIAMLLTCKYILQIDGWEDSRGATIEMQKASEAGIKKFMLWKSTYR